MATYYTKIIRFIIELNHFYNKGSLENFSYDMRVYKDNFDITNTQSDDIKKRKKSLTWFDESRSNLNNPHVKTMCGVTKAEPLSLEHVDVTGKKIKIEYHIYFDKTLVATCETSELTTDMPFYGTLIIPNTIDIELKFTFSFTSPRRKGETLEEFIKIQKISSPSNEPPWLKIAVEEAKKWANKKESKITTNYHKEVGYDSTLVKEAWCASFVNYCFKKVNIAYPTVSPAYSRAYIGHDSFFEIEKPCLGSIRVSKRGSVTSGGVTSGHVTFVYAKKEDGLLLCLGGNQADQIRLSSYSIDGQSAKYYLPLSYKDVYNSNKAILEKLTIYKNETVANKELFGITTQGGSSQA